MEQQTSQAFAQNRTEVINYLKSNFNAKNIEEMEKCAASAGYAHNELALVADKRSIDILWKAAQWDALQSKKPEVENKVKPLPTKASKTPVQSVPTAKIDKQVQRVKETGKMSDFAALLGSIPKG